MKLYSNKDFLESEEFPFSISTCYNGGPDNRIENHYHEFIEFVFVAEGSGIHTYKGSAYPISKGDVFIIEPCVSHSYHVRPSEELLVYNINMTPSFISPELEVLSKVTSFINFFYVEPFLRQTVDFHSHLTLEPRECLDLKLQMDNLLKEYTAKKMGYRIVIKTQLIQLFVTLSRFYDLHIHKPMTVYANEEEIIKRVCDYITVHHAQSLSLMQVSQLCGMSHSSFTSHFKKYVGKTFIEYRNALRINIAKDLLTKTDDKILVICHKIGFDDLSLFNKVFKRAVGLSPNQYREQMQLKK